MLFVVIPKFCISIVFSFPWGHFNSQEKLKTMLMQNFGVTNKEHYGMFWYFLEWSIAHLWSSFSSIFCLFPMKVARGHAYGSLGKSLAPGIQWKPWHNFMVSLSTLWLNLPGVQSSLFSSDINLEWFIKYNLTGQFNGTIIDWLIDP